MCLLPHPLCTRAPSSLARPLLFPPRLCAPPPILPWPLLVLLPPQLPDQKTVTGEEDESVAFSSDGTLFEFDAATGKWRERGKGEFRVNTNKAGQVRAWERPSAAARRRGLTRETSPSSPFALSSRRPPHLLFVAPPPWLAQLLQSRMVMRQAGHYRLLLNAKVGLCPGLAWQAHTSLSLSVPSLTPCSLSLDLSLLLPLSGVPRHGGAAHAQQRRGHLCVHQRSLAVERARRRRHPGEMQCQEQQAIDLCLEATVVPLLSLVLPSNNPCAPCSFSGEEGRVGGCRFRFRGPQAGHLGPQDQEHGASAQAARAPCANQGGAAALRC